MWSPLVEQHRRSQVSASRSHHLTQRPSTKWTCKCWRHSITQQKNITGAFKNVFLSACVYRLGAELADIKKKRAALEASLKNQKSDVSKMQRSGQYSFRVLPVAYFQSLINLMSFIRENKKTTHLFSLIQRQYHLPLWTLKQSPWLISWINSTLTWQKLNRVCWAVCAPQWAAQTRLGIWPRGWENRRWVNCVTPV